MSKRYWISATHKSRIKKQSCPAYLEPISRLLHLEGRLALILVINIRRPKSDGIEVHVSCLTVLFQQAMDSLEHCIFCSMQSSDLDGLAKSHVVSLIYGEM